MQSSICHNNKREKLTPEFSDINTGCWLPKIKKSKHFAAILYPLDIKYITYRHSFIYAVNVGTQKKKRIKRKPGISRLLSSTKEEENKIEL